MSIDTNSENWREVKEYCENRLKELRERNDDQMDSEETADIRGQIKFAKELIGLGEKKETPKVSDQGYL